MRRRRQSYRILGVLRASLTAFALVCGAKSYAEVPESVFVPAIDGPWWQVAGNPDVGQYTSDQQQPVDFAIWQAADGTWQLWACIRNTKYPGKTRLFYRWESRTLTAADWKPMGIAMTSEPSLGETEGGLQAPYVMKHGGEYLMFYGTWTQIALARSGDGKSFQRQVLSDGKVGMFYEGDLDANTRDPMALRIGDVLYLYYTASPYRTNREGADYVRTSRDLTYWSASKRVALGGEAGTSRTSAECPFVYFHEPSGYYYLFRTQRYGTDAQTRVYRSKDPANFGIHDDRYLVATLPVAAPELVESGGQLYLAALLPSLKGIQIAKLKFVIRSGGFAR
jgi:hypothetical protein